VRSLIPKAFLGDWQTGEVHVSEIKAGSDYPKPQQTGPGTFWPIAILVGFIGVVTVIVSVLR
jgi:hypothetical protein